MAKRGIGTLFSEQALKPRDIIEVSAQTGHGLEALAEAVRKIAQSNRPPQGE